MALLIGQRNVLVGLQMLAAEVIGQDKAMRLPPHKTEPAAGSRHALECRPGR